MQSGREVKKAVCCLCHFTCAVLVVVDGGKVISVTGDSEHPVCRGRICHKPSIAKNIHYHPDRLQYPLKRVGKRGEGKWTKILWDQALDEIAEKLMEIKRKYGPEALCVVSGDSRTDHWAQMRFANLFGTPNHFNPGIINYLNALTAHYVTYGAVTMPDIIAGVTRCLVEWGGNDPESNPLRWKEVMDARRKGAKLITIDPRYTEVAKQSNLWLQVRPGTDCALAMAWINVIVNDELYDKGFIEKYTFGFNKLKARVQDYSPEKVEEVTWIPAEKIVKSARMYASTKPAIILKPGVAGDMIGKNAVQFSRAQCVLRAITGNLDVEGGEALGTANIKDLSKVKLVVDLELNEKLSQEQKRKQMGSERFKLMTWPGHELLSQHSEEFRRQSVHWNNNAHWPTIARAILTGKPYPVRAMIAQATNLLLWVSNVRLMYEAIKALDLFVVMEYFMTPTSMLADYVLPATDWLERPCFVNDLPFLWNWVGGGERPTMPLDERRDDYQLWRSLGVRLGQKEYWWDTLEDAYAYFVKDLGYSSYQEFVDKKRALSGPREYMKYVKKGFETPSGKVEIYSSILEKLGFDPLPYYEEPAESPIRTPDLAGEYPLILSSGERVKYYYHSEYRQIESFRRIQPDPVVQINPETAARLGINNGDWVFIETSVGRIKQRAKLDPGVHPKVVHAQHGWWFPEERAEEPSLYGLWKSNINAVIDNDPEKCDPMCGSWPYRAVMCKVYKTKKE